MSRIIFVNRFFFPDVSATSQMLSDMAGGLATAGIEVHVVCSRQLYEDAKANLPALEKIGAVQVHRAWTSRFGRSALIGRALDYASFYFTSMATLLRLTRRTDILVIKTDPPLMSIAGAAIAGVRGATLVNWLQDVFPEVATRLQVGAIPHWAEKVLQSLRDWSMKRADINIVLGERMRDYFVSRGIPASRLRIIENWSDGSAVRPLPVQASRLRSELELQDRFVIGYSGNLGRAHEFRTILDAAFSLSGDPRFVFLMIGGGENMRELEKQARAYDLPNFRFLPYRSRELLADSLAAADVHLACLLPELEGFIVPSKVYGVLAAGRPTLFIGDVQGELPRMLTHTRCGLAVQSGDGDALAAELRALELDPVKVQLMGARARRVFEDRYTLDAASMKWTRALTELGTPAETFGPSFTRS